ncbi:MAG: HEAT repeat domain-containing protein [Alphaproteobacteria bacterium]|nr:HEAT repeat domain-containing protein [Alphaproteobacteria bacterium]
MQLKLCKLLIIFLVVFSFITFGHAADYNYVKEKVLVLKDGSEAEKIQVVQELGRLSSNANFIIDDLIFSLRNDESNKVRMEIIRALERIGGQANKTVPALIEALGDQNWEIRWSAAGALTSFGKKSAMAVPELVGLLRDSEDYVRNAALSTLGKMGPISVAAMMDEVAKPLDYSEDQLFMRIICIRSLGALGAKAMVSVPLLIKNSTHEDINVRLEAVIALRKIGGDDSMPGEIGWLAEPDEMIWPKVGPKMEGNFLMFAEAKQMVIYAIVDTLLQSIDDPDQRVSYAAIKGVANFGKKALPVKDKLVDYMNRGSPVIRRVAIDTLANMGEEADDVIPDLVTALSDFDVNVQWAAIQALRVKGNKAVPELIYMLEYDDDLLTPNILKTFAEIGNEAKDAVNNLLVMLEHDNPQYRALAAEALGEIGEPSKQIISSLESLRSDEDRNVIKTVEWSLNELQIIQSRRDNEN